MEHIAARQDTPVRSNRDGGEKNDSRPQKVSWTTEQAQSHIIMRRKRARVVVCLLQGRNLRLTLLKPMHRRSFYLCRSHFPLAGCYPFNLPRKRPQMPTVTELASTPPRLVFLGVVRPEIVPGPEILPACTWPERFLDGGIATTGDLIAGLSTWEKTVRTLS